MRKSVKFPTHSIHSERNIQRGFSSSSKYEIKNVKIPLGSQFQISIYESNYHIVIKRSQF